MDINKVKVLIYAVDNGSLLTAATKLGYTQAGLTHMMNSLESELGVVLLHRGKFGVRLTEEGERLMPLFKELDSKTESLYDSYCGGCQRNQNLASGRDARFSEGESGNFF